MRKTFRIALVVFALIGFAMTGLIAFAYIMQNSQSTNHFTDVPTFIKTQYGSYSARLKGYPPMEIDTESDPDHVMQLCLNEVVSIKGIKHHLLAMCGMPIKGVGDSHGQQGETDYYVLRVEEAGLLPVAQAQGFESGSHGQPGTVQIIKLGRDFYGFLVEAGGVWQGEQISNRLILVTNGDAITVAATLPASHDNSGAISSDCDTSQGDCQKPTQLRFKMAVDNSAPNAMVYPINIVASGMRDGKATSSTWHIGFDKKLWRYTVPDSLMKF